MFGRVKEWQRENGRAKGKVQEKFIEMIFELGLVK